MKPSEKLVGWPAYVAGALAVACALLLVILIVLAELGAIHPRKIDLVVETDTVTREYDGTPLVGKAEIAYGQLLLGHSVKILSQSSITKVGSVPNTVDLLILDRTGADVTDRYNIRVKEGTLSITKRGVSLLSLGGSRQYNGEPFQRPEIKLYMKYSLGCNGHNIEVINAPSLTEVDVIRNEIEYRITSPTGEDVTDQYELYNQREFLEVTRRPIYVKTGTVSKDYNGEPLSCADFTIEKGSLIEGHEMRVVQSTKLTKVGMVDNELTFAVYNAAGDDVTGCYAITQNSGTLTVKGTRLTITTGSASQVYNGKPLTCDTWTLSGGTLRAGHKLSVIKTTSLENAGSTDNVMRFAVTDQSGKDVTEYYEFTYAYGKLNVTPCKITIRTGSAQKVYDGKPLSNNSYEIISGQLCSGHTLTIVGRSRTDVGTSYNDVVSYTIKTKDANGRTVDVSGGYELTYDSGRITVSAPR